MIVGFPSVRPVSAPNTLEKQSAIICPSASPSFLPWMDPWSTRPTVCSPQSCWAFLCLQNSRESQALPAAFPSFQRAKHHGARHAVSSQYQCQCRTDQTQRWADPSVLSGCQISRESVCAVLHFRCGYWFHDARDCAIVRYRVRGCQMRRGPDYLACNSIQVIDASQRTS